MSDIRCNHCSQNYDDELSHCPYCHAPSPKQQEKNLSGNSKTFIYFFIALVIFCGVMIAWLPRVLR